MYTQQLTQHLSVAGRIAAASQAIGSYLTEAIDLSKARRVLFVIDAGTPGTSGTINFLVQGATTSGGTYTTISGTAITQLTATGVAVVEVTAEAVQALGLGYTFIKGQLTIGTAASPVSVVAYTSVARNEPNSKNNQTYVATPVVYS